MTKIDNAEMNSDKAEAALKNSLVCFAVASEESLDRPDLNKEILKITADLFELLKKIEKGKV